MYICRPQSTFPRALSPGGEVIGVLTSKWAEVSRLVDLGLSEGFQAGQQNQSE